MLSICELFTGQWGLVIDAWRSPNVIHSFSDLIENFYRVLHDFNAQFIFVSSKTVIVSIITVFVAVIYLFVSGRTREGIADVFVIIVTTLVMFSGFAQSIPYGLGVETRTAVFFFFSIFLLQLLAYKYCRLYGILAMVLISIVAYSKNNDSICFYTGVTNNWRGAIEKMEISSDGVKVHICSSSSQIARSERVIMNKYQLRNFNNDNFGADYKQFAIFHSLGFRSYDLRHEQCKKIKPENSNDLLEWTLSNRDLFVWYK